MFAIEITEENLEKILKSGYIDAKDLAAIRSLLHLKRYFVRGYHNGTVYGTWVIFPEHFFVKTFDFDPTVIKTDWDQIVRK